jgi:UDP-N-acetyl-D-mannosaminuronate dehydrogenase
MALVNELKIGYLAMGIYIWEVIEAARTKQANREIRRFLG